MNDQRRLDVDPQPSLFTDEEQDQLADIAAQASDEDRQAWAELSRSART